MTAKIAFRNTLQLKTQNQRVFVPFLYGLAARVTQTPLRKMVWDPAFYTHALEACNKLFGYHVVVNCFDSTIEAECCGCEVNWPADFDEPYLHEDCKIKMVSPNEFVDSGRIPVLMEATKRLSASLGRDIGLACVVTGPSAFGRSLLSRGASLQNSAPKDAFSFAATLLKDYVKRLCELKVDALFFREDTLGTDFVKGFHEFEDSLVATYKTLFNIIKFYNAFSLIIVRNIVADDLEKVCRALRPSGVIIMGRSFDVDDLLALKAFSESLKVSVGLSLPVVETGEKALWAQLELIESFLLESKTKGFFYSSDGAVPYCMPLEIIHSLMRRIDQN
jgi:hypothetical protein